MRTTHPGPDPVQSVPGRAYESPSHRPGRAGGLFEQGGDQTLHRAVLDSITEQLAVLDHEGHVLCTNASWKGSHATGHAGLAGSTPVGTSYLTFCERAAPGDAAAARALKGIRAVLSGKTTRFRLEYARHLPEGRRRQVMVVVPLRRASGGAIIVCTDTTRQRTAQRRARALSRLLLAAQERERRSVARELHDDVTQQIAAAALDLSVLLPRLPAGHEEVCAEVARMVERLRRLSSSVHGLSRRMHPHALEALGLGRALEGECRSFAERTGIGMTARIHAGDPTIPAPVALAVFRVCQEALNNVARHARATSVRVELDCSVDELRLSVRDTGVGFDVSRSHHGIGLPGMKERALAVGGRLSVASATGRGAAIRLSVPLFREQEP